MHPLTILPSDFVMNKSQFPYSLNLRNKLGSGIKRRILNDTYPFSILKKRRTPYRYLLSLCPVLFLLP